MTSISRRIAAAGVELWQMLRMGEIRNAIRFLARRVYSTGEMVLYERSLSAEQVLLPEEIKIRRVTREDAGTLRRDLEASGAREEISNFLRSADAYLLYLRDQPVASGWRMILPAKLLKLGYVESDCYLGGFIVRRDCRGRGLYPLLLRYMCAAAAHGCTKALLETAPTNISSQRGAQKAGFERRGLLRTTLLLGRPLEVRLVTPQDG